MTPFYFNRSEPRNTGLLNAINEINNGVARTVFLMGGEIEEKYDEKAGVGKIMEAVVGSAEKLAIWSNQIYQDQEEGIIVDQYLESVEIFIQSLCPQFEESNDVSINKTLFLDLFFNFIRKDPKFKHRQPLCPRRAWKYLDL